MNKIVAFDTEYNKNKEILSLGLATNNSLQELYFKNNVDKYSYQIHNLAHSFLNKEGLDFKVEKHKIHSKILSFQYIVGFNIEEDLHVLKFKQLSILFANNNFIDLKILFDLIGFSASLVKIGNIFDLNKELLKDLSPHNASYDSKLTLLILNEIIRLSKEARVSEQELLSDLKELTKLKHFKYSHELDSYANKFKWLKIKIEKQLKIKSISLKNNIHFNENLKYFFLDKSNIYILNNNNEICYKMPLSYIDLNKLIDLEKNQNFSVKYNEIGYRFNQKFISKQTVLFKFC